MEQKAESVKLGVNHSSVIDDATVIHNHGRTQNLKEDGKTKKRKFVRNFKINWPKKSELFFRLELLKRETRGRWNVWSEGISVYFVDQVKDHFPRWCVKNESSMRNDRDLRVSQDRKKRNLKCDKCLILNSSDVNWLNKEKRWKFPFSLLFNCSWRKRRKTYSIHRQNEECFERQTFGNSFAFTTFEEFIKIRIT